MRTGRVIGMGGGLAWAGLVVALVALGCAGAKGPGAGAGADEGIGVEEMDEEGIAGRGMSGRSAAERMGLRAVYFDYDSYALRDDAKATLRNNFDILRARPDVRLEIQGNCDERGSEEYNMALGERRARAAREYLVRLGIGGDRLSTVSFGESNPAVRGSGERAWSQNRRDDFSVLP